MKLGTLLKIATLPLMAGTMANGRFSNTENNETWNTFVESGDYDHEYTKSTSYNIVDNVYMASYWGYRHTENFRPPQSTLKFDDIIEYWIFDIQSYQMFDVLDAIYITTGTIDSISFWQTEDIELINFMQGSNNYAEYAFYTQVLPTKITNSSQTYSLTPVDGTNNIYTIVMDQNVRNTLIVKIMYDPAQTNSPYLLQNATFSYLFTQETIIKQEVFNLPELLFTVLTMPFAFISQAFNLTIFPNTPYQVNISNLFLAIIAVLVFVFIIKLIMSKS